MRTLFLMALCMAPLVGCTSSLETTSGTVAAFSIALPGGGSANGIQPVPVCCHTNGVLVVIRVRFARADREYDVTLKNNSSLQVESAVIARSAVTPKAEDLVPGATGNSVTGNIPAGNDIYLVVTATSCPLGSQQFSLEMTQLAFVGGNTFRATQTFEFVDCTPPAPVQPPANILRLNLFLPDADPTDGSRVRMTFNDRNTPLATDYNVYFTPWGGVRELVAQADRSINRIPPPVANDPPTFEVSHDPRGRLGVYTVRPVWGATEGPDDADCGGLDPRSCGTFLRPADKAFDSLEVTDVDNDGPSSFSALTVSAVKVANNRFLFGTQEHDAYVTDMRTGDTGPHYLASPHLAATIPDDDALLPGSFDRNTLKMTGIKDLGTAPPNTLPDPATDPYDDKARLLEGRYYAIHTEGNLFAVVFVDGFVAGPPSRFDLKVWVQGLPGLRVVGIAATPGPHFP